MHCLGELVLRVEGFEEDNENGCEAVGVDSEEFSWKAIGAAGFAEGCFPDGFLDLDEADVLFAFAAGVGDGIAG